MRALAVALLIAAGGTHAAQSSTPRFLRYDRPLRTARLDLGTGTITRGPSAADRAASTIADFTNLDLSGLVGIDSGGGACEWIDAGTKGFAGNASDLVTDIVVVYCSVMADAEHGGPGSSVLLGFYEGYKVGGPAPTTAVALYNLTGLPGHTANSSWAALATASGTATCRILRLGLANCLTFADGPIGYSWRFTDVGTTNVLAGTFPFLSCVQSCVGPGPDRQGMRDLIDQYCPPGHLKSTFSFTTCGVPLSGCSQYFTSIAMELHEVVSAEAVATSFHGDGINADVLSASAIVIGQSWETAIALGHAHGSSGPTSLKVRTSCINGPNLTSPTGHPFELLISGPLSLVRTAVHDGSSADFEPDFSIPCDASLLGLTWAAQGTVLGGGRADLTSARCGVVGSIDVVADP